MPIPTTAGIYVITCLPTNRSYVGSSVNIEARLREHRRCLGIGSHHCRFLQRSWVKHGADAFAFDVIEKVSIADLATDQAKKLLLSREQHFIDLYRAQMRLLNSCPKAGSVLGVKRSEETLARMSAAQRKSWASFSPERRAAKALAMRSKKTPGRKRSPEVLARIREARKPVSAETRAKMSAVRRGRKRSEESKAKTAAANLGSKRSPEARAKMSAAQRGRIKSDLTKAKISASLRGRPAAGQGYLFD